MIEPINQSMKINDAQGVFVKKASIKNVPDVKFQAEISQKRNDFQIGDLLINNSQDKIVITKEQIESICDPLENVKKQVIKDNENRLKSINNEYSLLRNKNCSEKLEPLVKEGKCVLKEFESRYGKPYSRSMDMLMQGIYYDLSSENSKKIDYLRSEVKPGNFEESDRLKKLSKAVKKYKAANCGEMSELVQGLFIEQGVPSSLIYYKSKGKGMNHRAVVIGGDKRLYKDGNYEVSKPSASAYDKVLDGSIIVDPWLGGIYKGEEWSIATEKALGRKCEKLIIQQGNVKRPVE